MDTMPPGSQDKYSMSFSNNYCSVNYESGFQDYRYENIFNLKDIANVEIDKGNSYYDKSGLRFICKKNKKCITEKYYEHEVLKYNEAYSTTGSYSWTTGRNSKITKQLEKAFDDLISKCSGNKELY